MKASPAAGAFTLIELLVVIAIIAVLPAEPVGCYGPLPDELRPEQLTTAPPAKLSPA